MILESIDVWSAAGITVKALSYVCTLAAAGGVFFLAYSGDAALLPVPERQLITRWIWGLAGAAAATSGAQIVVTAASMSGDVAGMFELPLLRMVWWGGAGRACVVRISGLLIAGVSLAYVQRTTLPPSAAAAVGAVGAVGAALAASSFAWVGHTHAAAATRGATALVCLHLLCVAFWIGAMLPLFIISRAADRRRVAVHVQRFGSAAIGVVGALLGAGVCSLWSLLGHLERLWTSGYGRLALCKIAVVAGLLSIAAFNRLRLTPRLSCLEAAAVPLLRRALLGEMAIAGLILVVTATLTTVTGPE